MPYGVWAAASCAAFCVPLARLVVGEVLEPAAVSVTLGAADGVSSVVRSPTRAMSAQATYLPLRMKPGLRVFIWLSFCMRGAGLSACLRGRVRVAGARGAVIVDRGGHASRVQVGGEGLVWG